MSGAKFAYAGKYFDDHFEYRNVEVRSDVFKRMPKGRLLSQQELRSLGLNIGDGWEHHGIHSTEPHILMLRRRIQISPYGPCVRI